MKNKATAFFKAEAVITWYKVELYGAYQGKYKARLVEYDTEPFTDFDVFVDYDKAPLVTNTDVIDLVKEAIKEITDNE